MKNVKMEVKENKLLIEIDLTKNFGTSKSGKSVIIASTGGNVKVKDNINIGLNVYDKK